MTFDQSFDTRDTSEFSLFISVAIAEIFCVHQHVVVEASQWRSEQRWWWVEKEKSVDKWSNAIDNEEAREAIVKRINLESTKQRVKGHYGRDDESKFV